MNENDLNNIPGNTVPTEPVQPVTPEVPAEPVAPVAPVVPEAPVAPAAPSEPIMPEAPELNVEPTAPAAPAAPEAPVAPAAPEAPAAPSAPVQPTQQPYPGFNPAGVVEQPQPPKKNNMFIIIVVVLVLAIGGCVVYLLLNNKKDDTKDGTTTTSTTAEVVTTTGEVVTTTQAVTTRTTTAVRTTEPSTPTPTPVSGSKTITVGKYTMALPTGYELYKTSNNAALIVDMTNKVQVSLGAYPNNNVDYYYNNIESVIDVWANNGFVVTNAAAGSISGLNVIALDATLDGEYYGIMYVQIPSGGTMEVLMYNRGSKSFDIIMNEIVTMIKNSSASFAAGEEKTDVALDIDAIDTRLFN